MESGGQSVQILFHSTEADVACKQLGFIKLKNFGRVDSLGLVPNHLTNWLHVKHSDMLLKITNIYDNKNVAKNN